MKQRCIAMVEITFEGANTEDIDRYVMSLCWLKDAPSAEGVKAIRNSVYVDGIVREEDTDLSLLEALTTTGELPEEGGAEE